MGNSTSSGGDDHGSGGGSTSTIAAETETGRHVVKVCGYSKTQGVVGVGKFISSGTFTVGGHSWCIRHYPDGFDGKNPGWISVSLYLTRPSSFRAIVMARFRLSLLDTAGQPIPGRSFEWQRPFSIAGQRSWGVPRFIPSDGGVLVEGSGILEDDCFSIACDLTVFKGAGRAAATKPFVKVPPSAFSEELGRLLYGGQGADVTFVVGGELFSAHRSILAARSPVFKAELFGPMMEKAAARVQVHDMEPVVFRAMLHFVYTDSLLGAAAMGVGVEDRVAMAQHLLVAADRFGLRRLKLICEDFLCNHVSKRTAATSLVLAVQHGCQGLRDACFAFLESPKNLKAVMATDGYDHLRSSCPLIHDELVNKLASTDAFKGNKVKRSPGCFSC
ncbi:hypothetical protein BS78_05G215100 [Paspalum vaginatum]|nr:hypothetical protein BS78_05G215100 [Paspalum vaginatum]